VAREYKGDSHALFMAIGALFVGRLYGWKVIRVFISTTPYARCQKILGLDFKDVMEAETPLSDRALAYRVVKRLKEFWGIVKGQLPIEDYGVSRNDKRILADN
jgi:hypothetical protein